MKVCDMCLKGLENTDKGAAKILDVNGFLDEDYSLCPKCRRKLKKYINFEKNKNKRRIGAFKNE